MQQFLIHINAMRRVAEREVLDVLLHLDRTKGEQVWLLGTKGTRRLVEDVNQFDPERWKRFCSAGLVYVTWLEQWAFAPELDAKTKLPQRMETYEEAYRKLLNPEPPKPQAEQLTLQEQPAGDGTTQQS